MPPTHAQLGRGKVPSFRGREARRAVIAACGMACVFAAAFAIGVGWQTPSLRETAFAPSSQADHEGGTTGSIVSVPVLGDTCRKTLIDNRSGKVLERGPVSCERALAESRRRRSGRGATRFDVIRESFRKSAR